MRRYLLPLISFIFIGCTDHLEEGKALFEEGHYEAALPHFTEHLSIEPYNPIRLYQVARCYEELGKYEKAIDHYEKAITQWPEYYEAYIGRGNAYFKQDQFHLAVIDYKSATNLNKENVQGFYLAGLCYMKDSVYDEAAYFFDKALEIQPENHKARYHKAVSNAARANVLFALKDFYYLINENYLLEKCYFNRGILFQTLNNYGGAIHDFSKAMELGNINERILQERANCYIQIKDMDKACKDLHKMKNYNDQLAQELINSHCAHSI